MTPEPCPTCKGRCCVNKYGSPSEHRAALALHSCPDCDDGTYEVCGDPESFVPPRTAEDERADVVAYLRANTCGCHDFAGDIASGGHIGAAKKPSDKV